MAAVLLLVFTCPDTRASVELPRRQSSAAPSRPLGRESAAAGARGGRKSGTQDGADCARADVKGGTGAFVDSTGSGKPGVRDSSSSISRSLSDEVGGVGVERRRHPAVQVCALVFFGGVYVVRAFITVLSAATSTIIVELQQWDMLVWLVLWCGVVLCLVLWCAVLLLVFVVELLSS